MNYLIKLKYSFKKQFFYEKEIFKNKNCEIGRLIFYNFYKIADPQI
jgi:hypothetical protein